MISVIRHMNKSVALIVLSCLLAGCAFEDSRTARTAQRSLMGWSEVDLEACAGAPDQHSTFGDTDILTYYGTSTSNKGVALGVPLIGSFNLGGGGYCHATFRVQHARVTELHYSGETNATLAPDAYCAPIVRGCVHQPERLQAEPPAQR